MRSVMQRRKGARTEEGRVRDETHGQGNEKKRERQREIMEV